MLQILADQYVGDAIGITSRGRELMNVIVRFLADNRCILK